MSTSIHRTRDKELTQGQADHVSSSDTVIWFYKKLLQVRPAPIGVAIKKALGIRRRTVMSQDGITLWVDPVSQFGLEILSEGVYEPALGKLIQALLRPGDGFIDLGANEGYFSVIGSRCVSPQGWVWSIEPQTRLQPVIQKNLSLNGLGNVRVIQAAVSDTCGPQVLHLSSSNNSGATSLVQAPRFGRRTEVVTGATLDEWVGQLDRVRLLKVDCEGAEEAILRGAAQSLARRVFEYIVLDYHPQIAGEATASRIDGQLRNAGYALTRCATGCWVYHLAGAEAGLRSLGPTQAIAPL